MGTRPKACLARGSSAYPKTNTYTDADPNARTCINIYSNPNYGTHTHFYPATGAYPDANAYTNPNSRAHSHSYPDAYTYDAHYRRGSLW
jgi:hypothetical protein